MCRPVQLIIFCSAEAALRCAKALLSGVPTLLACCVQQAVSSEELTNFEAGGAIESQMVLSDKSQLSEAKRGLGEREREKAVTLSVLTRGLYLNPATPPPKKNSVRKDRLSDHVIPQANTVWYGRERAHH